MSSFLVFAVILNWITCILYANNIIIENQEHTHKWWLAFYIRNVDLSCGGTIDSVDIIDNNHITWHANDASYIWGYYAFDHINFEFTLPISIRITKTYNNNIKRIWVRDVITSFDANAEFNFGTNFCTNPTPYPTLQPTSPTTPQPTQSPILPTPHPTPYPTLQPTSPTTPQPTQSPILPTPHPTQPPVSGNVIGNYKLATISSCGTGKYVSLTFDDGPSIDHDATLTIINRLNAHGMVATFYVSPAANGENENELDIRCNLINELTLNGNEIQSHSWNHPNFETEISSNNNDEIDYQLDATSDFIVSCGGIAPTIFRPPFGALTKSQAQYIVQTKRYILGLWNLDSKDYESPNNFNNINKTISNTSKNNTK
eukprot:312316_1